MIVRFETPESRADFIEEVRSLRADIDNACRIADNLPDLVFTGLTSEQTAWIKQHVKGRGHVFSDFKLETFESQE